MEGAVRRGSGYAMSPVMVMLALVFAILVFVPHVSATRWTVGGSKFWNPNVNYTVWAKDIHFYNGDWLYFIYDRNQMDVLEVNKTDYENCIADHPLHNWTRGAGRDVVPLNVTRTYYFISGKGFCFGGMKLSVTVKNPPPPPTGSPLNEKSAAPFSNLRGQYVLPAVFAIGALWDAFVHIW